MEEWEKLLIKDAFDKSPGLKESLKAAIDSGNENLKETGMEFLAIRSGFRIEFIEKHIEEIINL